MSQVKNYNEYIKIFFYFSDKVLSQQIVDKVHELAIKNGGINEGDPGIREGYDNMYFSYFRDLDNNKICIYSEL